MGHAAACCQIGAARRQRAGSREAETVRPAASRERTAGEHLLVGEQRTELVHALQRHAGTAHHTGERVFGHQHRQTGLFHQQTVQIAQQRATTGEHHALLSNVGTQLGRGLFQRVLDGRDNAVQRIGQRLQHLVAGDRE